MNIKNNLLFVAIFIIAGISFGIPMLVSGGNIRDTHADDLLLVTISPSPTMSTAQVQTKQAFAQMFFSPTASFTAIAPLQSSETPYPSATLEDTTTPSETSTFTITPTATHPYITFTTRPNRDTTSVPPTSTPQPRPTNPPPTNPPPTEAPTEAPTNPPATEAPTEAPTAPPATQAP